MPQAPEARQADPPASAAPARPPVTELVAGGRRAQALARIEASRLRLRGALMPEEAERARRRAAGDTAPAANGLLGDWLQSLREQPATRWAQRLARRWWQRHPWRPAVQLVSGEAGPVLRRTVRRHPVLTLGAASAAGASLAMLARHHRPWLQAQWQSRTHRWPQRLWRWGSLHLAGLPIQSMVQTAVTLWLARRASDEERAAERREADGRREGPENTEGVTVPDVPDSQDASPPADGPAQPAAKNPLAA